MSLTRFRIFHFVFIILSNISILNAQFGFGNQSPNQDPNFGQNQNFGPNAVPNVSPTFGQNQNSGFNQNQNSNANQNPSFPSDPASPPCQLASGCPPPSENLNYPRTNSFWPNAQFLADIQKQNAYESQNQNPNSNQNQNQGQNPNQNPTNPIQQDDPNARIPPPDPVIYIARAGSQQYRYDGQNSNNQQSNSEQMAGPSGSSNQLSLGNNLDWNHATSNGNGGNSNNFGPNPYPNYQNQNQNNQMNQNQNQNQNQNNQNAGTFSSFSNNNQNPSPFQNGGQNQNWAPNPMAQNQNQYQNQNSFGPYPSNNQGPDLMVGLSKKDDFRENEWNFQPDNKNVHFVGSENEKGVIGSGIGSSNQQMSEEARQIGVQIQAIRENLSISKDESNYLIQQLVSSLPKELQNQLNNQLL